MSEKNNELVQQQDAALSLTQGSGNISTSVDMSTEEGKLRVFGALQDSQKIEDHLNEDINLKDVVMQTVDVVNESTGEVDSAVRTTLIDDKGKAYSATSSELVKSLRTMMGIWGEPNTWEKPIKVKVTTGKSRKGFRFFTIVPSLGR